LRGAEIDTMLLSCRALGRGVEHRMLAFLADRGHNAITARLRPTAKNAPARQFLKSLGSAGETQADGVVLYRFPAASLRGLEWKPAPAPSATRETAPAPETLPDRPDYVRIAKTLSTPEEILAEMRRRNRPDVIAPAVDAPSTETERKLAELWADLLRVPSISSSDNFFDLGGHSLLAVLLLTRVHEAFGVELEIDDVYSAGLTLAGLAARIEELQFGGSGPAEYAALLKEIEEMSDEEARQALAKEDGDTGRA
jgi:acyl carrier protein